ncbi:MAG TPA: metallophosphoesterase [Pyrinomonadaceae bacterium]|nr:metallophosphoesterase [Pyrinomonadaceae bacterium]
MSRLTVFLLGIAIIAAPPPAVSSRVRFRSQAQTPANFKIAFIGDQALGPNAVAVLNLIKLERAQALLHSGDLDYVDNPTAWEDQINSVLGPDFPYFVTIGNHDELAWRGPTGYQQYITNRFNRLGVSWSGDLGVQSTFHYQGIFFVLTPPGILSGFDAGNSDTYIRDQLAADDSIWSICSWHKNQRLMQVGGKPDETGWPVYEEAMKGGAIIATAHEHSYSRTHLLSSMINQTIASTSNTLTLTKGNSFAFVSGLGGENVRPQLLSGPWWASISAATCLAGDTTCQANGQPGALFGVFNVDGQPNKALFYFKDVSGRVIDTFTLISNVQRPVINALSPASAAVGGSSFALTVHGENFGNGSVVRWNNSDKPTNVISTTQLSATISAADIAMVGSAQVTVSSPGGTSSGSTFNITNPAPVISVVQPNHVDAGSGGFALNVIGSHFVNGSVVRWNGADRATTFISSTQLAAMISAADVKSGGNVPITVANPDGVSDAAIFMVTPPSLVLITETTSDRAIALDSVFFLRDPFALSSPFNLSEDKQTRIILFSPNLSLLPSDGPANVVAEAEDSQHRTYPIKVEFVGQAFEPGGLTQIVVKLPVEVGGANALWLHLSYRGAASNKAMISLR